MSRKESDSPRKRYGYSDTLLVLGAAGVLALGVYDNLKGGIVESVADWVRYHWYTPVYILELTEPVVIDPDQLALLPVGGGQAAKPQHVRFPPSSTDGRAKHIEVTVYPGIYYVQLERSAGSKTQVLAEQVVRLRSPEDPAKIDTSESQWSTREALTTGETGGKVSGTRWTLAPSDSDALAASDGHSAAILRAALGQLGIWEGGSDADRRAITAYWKAAIPTGGPEESDPTWGLWGGAFLAWAVAQSGGTPPKGAAAFQSWRNWGTAIDPSVVKPGAMAIVEIGPSTPSRLMVGVLLHRRPDCVEMITGNLANRVAITCLQGRVLSFRSAD